MDIRAWIGQSMRPGRAGRRIYAVWGVVMAAVLVMGIATGNVVLLLVGGYGVLAVAGWFIVMRNRGNAT